jgi:DNA-directed RNA polymerase sigma subunit (sigma70/sigma32)
MSKKYNLADRRAANTLRRECVIVLRSRGHTFRSIGYALGITPGRVRQIYLSQLRRVNGMMRAKEKIPVVSPATVQKYSSSFAA